MPGVSSTDAPAQKDIKDIEIVDQYRFCQDHFFLNAFDIQAVWRGILLHRGNIPQQGCVVGGCQKRIYFLFNDQNLRVKNRKHERENRKSVIHFRIHFKDTF
jgi:hypothetical protein